MIIIKVLKFNTTTMKIIKILEFHARIPEFMKKMIIFLDFHTSENQENYENHRIPYENHENY